MIPILLIIGFKGCECYPYSYRVYGLDDDNRWQAKPIIRYGGPVAPLHDSYASIY